MTKKTTKAPTNKTSELPREGTKNRKILDLMRSRGGATMAELLKATGWKRCTGTMRVVARTSGFKVTRHPGKAGAASRFAATR